jgi:hypothetical protein
MKRELAMSIKVDTVRGITKNLIMLWSASKQRKLYKRKSRTIDAAKVQRKNTNLYLKERFTHWAVPSCFLNIEGFGVC